MKIKIDFFVRRGIQKTFYKVRNSTGAVSLENRLAAFWCKKQQKYNFFERDRFFLFCYNKIIDKMITSDISQKEESVWDLLKQVWVHLVEH